MAFAADDQVVVQRDAKFPVVAIKSGKTGGAPAFWQMVLIVRI